VPRDQLDKVHKEGMKFPRSILALDIWGGDVLANGVTWERGDGDGVCMPCGPLLPILWGEQPRSQILTTMFEPDGTPFMGDPRQILKAVVEQCRADGYRPVVALELEFYLMGGESVARAPVSGYELDSPRVYAIDELSEFSAVLSAMRRACAGLGLPTDSIMVENGRGQFEITLTHQADALLAADHAIHLRRAVRGVARDFGLHGTFMAKPYGDSAGSGLHIHCSLLDEAGNNLFDDGSEAGSPLLRFAVAGLLAAARESFLIFAPHANSYRRFVSGAHAPVSASWGYENRTAAVRIPMGAPAARRFEHRLAGADANPYLVTAALLAAMLHGLRAKDEPPPPIVGNGYEETAQAPLPRDWLAAIEAFEQGHILQPYLGPVFRRAFSACKRQEREVLERRVTDVEYHTYLGPL
jgi:glutamine synthetase